MPRSQRALRFREGIDSTGATAYAKGELSLLTPLQQRTKAAAMGAPIPPANTTLPAISGTLTVGQTLTTTNGTWTGVSPTYTRQWFRGNHPIPGATATTRVLAAADAGFRMSCRVTATDVNGSSTVFSARTNIVP